ncbi:MAG: MFS transporter [Firmicutes bacterium]|nr:MFS transporter [Alicyclobacillaceae bacterium]MCL6497745.1 MFS transporter [Bacillota bacterium]
MRGDLVWLTASLGLRGLSFGLYLMLWPLYVEHLGGGPVALGSLAAVGGAVSALVLLPGGWLADRWDRRQLAIAAGLLAAPAPLLFAWAPSWRWLIPGMVLFHAAQFARPALQAIVAEAAPPNVMASRYGVVMSAFEAGMAVGPPVGAWMAEAAHGFGPVFVAAAVLSGLAVLALLPLRPHPQRARGALRPSRPRPWHRPALRRWIGFMAVFATVQSLAFPFAVPYWRGVGGLGLETLGWIGSVGIAAATVAGPLWGWLAERIGFIRALGWGLGFTAVGWALVAGFPRHVGVALLAATLRGAEEGCGTVAGAAIGRTVPPEDAGTAYGWFNWVAEVGRAVGPVPGGLLYRWWPTAPFLLTAAITAALAFAFLDTLPPVWRQP